MAGKRRGPDPDTLKIEGKDWEQEFKRAVSAKKPKSGWPDRAVNRRKRSKTKRK